MREIRLKIELFPAPLGPMIDRISPFSTAKLTASTAFRPPKCSDRFSARK
jgi:hypothetical protein